MQRFFEDRVSQPEGRIREGDQVGFNKHLKRMGMAGKETFISQYIKDEEGRLLRGVGFIREGWVKWFHIPSRRPLTRPSSTSLECGLPIEPLKTLPDEMD